MTEKIRVLFLFSDTGGGHRSAAEAIIEALHIEYGEIIEPKMVDFFKACPFPFYLLPELYGPMVKVPEGWGMGFKLTNGHRRYKVIHATVHPYVRRSIKKIVKENPADAIVSVHPLVNAAVLKELGESHPPYITVVTDLISTHAGWFHYKPDLCVVPTDGAYQKALENGCDPDRIMKIGLPIADKFCQDLGDPQEIKKELGWDLEKPTILVVGGGEGMGPLEDTARTINDSGLDVSLAVICGHNEDLKKKLSSEKWDIPVNIYGFVKNMPTMMVGADVLVTKAGPGTITEAVNAGLPILLYSFVPGQEEGNVDFVVDNDLGAYTPKSQDMIKVLRTWLDDPVEYKRVQQNCHDIARPTSAREIAHHIVEMAREKMPA